MDISYEPSTILRLNVTIRGRPCSQREPSNSSNTRRKSDSKYAAPQSPRRRSLPEQYTGDEPTEKRTHEFLFYYVSTVDVFEPRTLF